MRWIAVSLVAALAIFGLAPSATPADASEVHIQDQAFLLYATEMDLAQIRLGRLAADKSARTSRFDSSRSA